MLPILAGEQFAKFWTQSAVPALVRTDFAPQYCTGSLLALQAIIETIDSRETKLNPLPGDGMMSLFGC
jgi:hypothetical protein